MKALKEKFAAMSQREQILVLVAGGALLVIVLLLVISSVRNNIKGLEQDNDKMRRALVVMSDHRKNGVPGKAESGVKLPDEKPRLTTILDSAAERASQKFGDDGKILIPRKNTLEGNSDGDTGEELIRTDINGLLLTQTLEFLKELEKTGDHVLVKELELRRDIRDKDKVNMRLVVSAFYKEKKDEDKEGDQ